jgi:microcystin-dependent protein
MPLSRLENFLKDVQGNVIYVNPSELDATDDINNQGNSRTRPFKTIQRALLESARFSYQLGKNNDKIDKTTIFVAPGIHYIDNRPGLAIDTGGNLTDINGSSATIDQLSVGTNFDINDPNNVLWKFNSIHGGVILPRGTSVVGQDLRKTKIRPKYVPEPGNSNIQRSAIFRVTGTCWFFGFSFFDADPNDRVYRDYTTSVYSPNYSHHKLTCFEYADGVNIVPGKGNTDLDMYYHKLSLAYGVNSGRALPDYPTNTDFEAVVDEYRIVGALSQIGDILIEDIYSGTNPTDSVATSIVTVVTRTNHNLSVGTPILITGVDNPEYDGSWVVAQVTSETNFTYQRATSPTSTATPDLSGKNPRVFVESDSVSSASPYVFNCSVRSVYGLNGMWADGDKATGFKSMVVAQFTGISLNKDDNAYVKYNTTTGVWEDQTTLGSSISLHTNSLAKHKPDWQNFHIKVSNSGLIQAVSVFAIGYAQHFVAENGGDMSITNSNSNFGAKALESDRFRGDAFLRDDYGYITDIVPPQKNTSKETNINYLALDVNATAGVATDTKLYLYGYNQKDTVPPRSISGYIVGNRVGDNLYCEINNIVYEAPILMPVPQSNPNLRISARKEYFVGRSSGINSITGNTFTLETSHRLNNGESVRIVSENGSIPDGIEYRKIYYAITNGLNPDQIQLATTFNNALSGDEIVGINNLGGKIKIVSNVSDKLPGEPGHPIQFDGTGWYIGVGVSNSLRSAIAINQAKITPKTSNTTIRRTPDIRTDSRKIYRLRYAIPENALNATPPANGYILQESSSEIDDTIYQNDSTNITSVTNLRTNTNIINASWNSNVGIITTQYPHNLKVGNLVSIKRLKSTVNVIGSNNLGFNGLFDVLKIDDSKTFRIGLSTNPGSISTVASKAPYTFEDISVVGSGRTDSPYFSRKDFGPAFQIYNQQTIQEYKSNIQDGIYDLGINAFIYTPEVSPFSTSRNRFSQNLDNFYPSIDLDNPNDDPSSATSYAVRNIIGKVETNDSKLSVTRETLNEFFAQTGIGIGITGASFSGTTLTLDTNVEHNLNSIQTFTITNSGSSNGRNSGSAEFYYNVNFTGGSGTGATADITVNAAGQITLINLIDRGSGYRVNDVLTLRNVPTYGSPTLCTIRVNTIYSSIGDAIQVVGVGSTSYNGTYRIKTIPGPKQISYTGSASGVSTAGGYIFHVGISTNIVDIKHDALSGIATVLLKSDIGLRSGDQIVINGCTGFSTVYNGTFFIGDRVGYGSSLLVNIGITTNAPAFTGIATAHGTGIGIRSKDRRIPIYGGVTDRLISGMTTTTTSLSLSNNLMFRRGDFLLIENEIVRITNNDISQCLRGLLGTNATQHLENTSVRKIRVLPVENRRYSILRASGHTFEYLGFGPGNYSTAMPSNQDRRLSFDEELLSQSLSTRGGLVVYTGMNSNGEFFIGRKKFDATTGEEIALTEQIETVQEEVITTNNSAVYDDLTVNNNLYSKGNTEVVDLALKGNRSGDISQTVYVGIQNNNACPTSANDNILFRTTFTRGGYIGWVKTNEANTANRWKRWGKISHECSSDHYVFDKIGVGVTYCADQYSLQVVGVSTFSGNLFITGVSTFSGNLSITGFTTSTAGVNIGAGNTYYVNGNPLLPVGMVMPFAGTTAPAGYLLCSGQAISRITYAALFNSIGTTYGAGDGTTTFNVPDLRGRVIAAPDNMGGSAANRLHGRVANSSQTTNYNAPGVVGGEQDHVQSVNELAQHAHPNSASLSNMNHTHNILLGDNANSGSGDFALDTGSNKIVTTQNPNNWNPSVSVTINNNGSSFPMNNVQPTIAMNYIIFANA